MPGPELITEGKTFPCPYGLYEALISEPFEFESVTESQAHSYSFGTRLDLTHGVGAVHWTVTPPDDYFYHLEGIRVAYPEDTVTGNVLRVMVQQKERGRNITESPIPVPIMTTPGDQRRRLYMVRTNTLFGPSMNIFVSITGQNGTNPAYVDLMTEGLYIPAHGLRPA